MSSTRLQLEETSLGRVVAQLLLLGATQKVIGFAVLGAAALAPGLWVSGWLESAAFSFGRGGSRARQ